jgi:anaerobic selenocysteine-containing dehydrogenase
VADIRTHVTYCRICPAHCGIEVEVAGAAVTRVGGDKAHPLTHGFTCAKGRRIGDFHADPDRLLESQRRGPDGTFEPLEVRFPVHDNTRALTEARRRGLKLMVVDPRRSQVAANADIHLQIRPGTDAALMAGLHHVILREVFYMELAVERGHGD